MTLNKAFPRTLVLLMLFLCLVGEGLGEQAPLDYTDPANWAYYALGEDKTADLFLLCPTVDMGRAGNAHLSMDDTAMKENFVGALNMERGIYEDVLTLYAPYYRQAAFTAYFLPSEEAAPLFEFAYQDVRAAFLTFAQLHPDRPFVLAGFSQGADMVLRLMREFFSDPAYQQRLIAAYCIGWNFPVSDADAYPWMKPATGESDLGCIISFSTEAANAPASFIVPQGIKTFSINPLNWCTDATPADASLNKGACFTDYSGTITQEIPHLTGAVIDDTRGVLLAPDVTPADYPGLIFPDGIYHLYDYQFFFRNLQENVSLRTRGAAPGPCLRDKAP